MEKDILNNTAAETGPKNGVKCCITPDMCSRANSVMMNLHLVMYL